MNPELDIQIDYLGNHPEAVEGIAAWFFDDWRVYYSDESLEDVVESVRERANTDKLPLALVALHEGQVIGTVCLKKHDMDVREDLSPWVAGLYVAAPYRGRGIGALLMRSILEQGRKLGISHLYLWTPRSENFYAKMGWSVLQRMTHEGTEITVMERDMAGDDRARPFTIGTIHRSVCGRFGVGCLSGESAPAPHDQP